MGWWLIGRRGEGKRPNLELPCLPMRTPLTFLSLLTACGTQPQLSAGADQVCLLHPRELECWRYDYTDSGFWTESCNRIVAQRPGVEFADLSIGGGVACGIELDGRLRCWGEPAVDDPGPWARVVAGPGSFQACALDHTGSIGCWSSVVETPFTSPPAGSFELLWVGGPNGCALDAQGALSCWGTASDLGWDDPPEGEFTDLALSAGAALALDANGELHCWGLPGACDELGIEDPSGWLDIDGGEHHLCGLDRRERLHCWGMSPLEEHYSSYRGQWTWLSAGGSRVCGGVTCTLDQDGDTQCRIHAHES